MIVSFGPLSAMTVSFAVTGVIPPPETVTVLVISDSAKRGANALVSASYTMVTFPPAGTLIPETERGGPAVTAGVVYKIPLL